MLDFHSAWRTRGDELSDSLEEHHAARAITGDGAKTAANFMPKAQNLVRRLRGPMTRRLARYDLLLIATFAMWQTPLPEADAPIAEICAAPSRCWPNCAIRLHHHPAMMPPLRAGSTACRFA